MLISLEDVYQCKDCKAILDKNKLDVVKTDMIYKQRCPVCGCCDLMLLKIG